MDEVWKDLSLSSLFPPTTTPAAASAADGLVFQDFFASASSNVVKDTTPSNKIPETDRPHQQRITNIPSLFNASPSPVGMCPRPGRKKFPANQEDPIDLKRKRLMKNRESAARSRARRQAYTYELEAEVAHLMEENANLKKQVEKLRSAAASDGGGGVGGGGDGGFQNPKRQRIHRTLSGPF